MKKKILILGIIAILIAMLCFLTGCGNNNTINNVNSNDDSGKSVENFDKVTTVATKVYAVSCEYAVVEGKDNNVYVIDKKGNYQGTLNISINEDKDTIEINNDGYIYYRRAEDSSSKILDKTGNGIYESTSNVSYYNITDYNYTLRKSEISDFENGSSTKYEVIDLSGNIIIELESNETYLGGHIWASSSKLTNDVTGAIIQGDTRRI